MFRCMLSLLVLGAVTGCSESVEVREFKAAVRELVKEGRAGVKMLENGSSNDAIDRQAEKLSDLNNHVPELPAGIDATGELAKQIDSISKTFQYAMMSLNLHDQAKTNTTDKELMDSTKAKADEYTNELKSTLDTIEKTLGL